MFKRLSKSRRHSADEVGCSLPPGPVTLEEPPGLAPRRSLEGQIQALNTALLRVSRNKYARRSCGDAPSMQSLLASVDEQRSTAIRPRVEADYQTVTAVPAFIVEHEPEKLQPQQQQRGLGVWGRRMSKKIESFRRAGSRESICSPSDRADHQSSHENNNDCIRNNNNNNNDNANNNNERLCSVSVGGSNDNTKKSGLNVSQQKTPEMLKAEAKAERKLSGTSHRSPSPFKSFFIRMGSTGMLNSTRSNRRSQNLESARVPTTEKDNLFRSCSTSHLNASPTYVKGDDPSEGIDLQIAHRKDRTLSCDDLAARHQADEDVFENDDDVDDDEDDDEASLDASSRASSSSFRPCDFGDSRNEVLRKSSSCDFKETKKCNFPYAFLRSRLSVLPEERQQQQHHQQQQQHQQHVSSAKDDRLFKATSEEHFPALKIEDSFDGTTTLGRRRTRNPGGRQENGQRYSRNSYAEYSEGRLAGSLARCEQDRYSLNPSRLERIEDSFQQEDRFYVGAGYPRSGSAAGTSVNRLSDSGQTRDASADFSGRLNDRRFSETSSLNADLDVVATLRSQRRNSAPSAEQRLSSHYVSSNESGYDSDGPRGESAAASENEAASLKCVNTDSSDTSSVIDSEIEKPMRSSTPSECTERDSLDSLGKVFAAGPKNPGGSGAANEVGESIDGLRWHQSSSGRILPSIHQGSYTADDSVAERLSRRSTESPRNVRNAEKAGYTPPHRARLQQDKTRFLSDIIQAPKRIRRCRVVQLDKRDARESLGIRLAQQQAGELRYIVVQLESGGIAHRDGRLRLGDEIVEVEGRELKTLESLAEVQEFLRSFTGNKVRLTTAYEETLPQVFDDVAVADDDQPRESLENAKNLSSLPPIATSDSPGRPESSLSRRDDTVQLRKRPDNLPLSKNRREAVVPSAESLPESQQYLTKHRAKFEKGYGKPSLGFSVVGGRDSPRGEMGIFVRRVFPGGQADISKSLFQGDEILSLNGKVLRGYTHQEVIELFKAVREGPVELELARRHRYPRTPLKSAPY